MDDDRTIEMKYALMTIIVLFCMILIFFSGYIYCFQTMQTKIINDLEDKWPCKNLFEPNNVSEIWNQTRGKLNELHNRVQTT